MASNFWKTEITYLKKVGPKRAAALNEEAGIYTYGDLLSYFPRKYIDRSKLHRIRDIRRDTPQVSILGKIIDIEFTKGKRGGRLSATFTDGTGFIDLVWFKGINWVRETLKENEDILIFGSPRIYGRSIQIAHPEIERGKSQEEILANLAVLPVYSSTEKLGKIGLDAKGIRQLTKSLLELGATKLTDNLPAWLRQRYKLPTRQEAFNQIHFPTSLEALEAAKHRLKFEEFFFFQMVMARRKLVEQPQRPSHPFPRVGDYFNRFYQEFLPFELTGAQKRVLKEIRADLARPVQMNRLIQGDVGSGKTMVAFMSMLLALDNGFQAAIMAPTEILAEQHYNNMVKYGGPLGIRSALLTGSVKGTTRKQLLYELREGVIQIIVGTHALIEDKVRFRRLGLAIVDEQHKFGVMQRMKLWHKSEVFPHNMVMTATPIPRTLALTIFGDVDVSQIDEMPPGRKPVITAVRSEAQRLQVFGFLRKELDKGRQVYVVYPLVEESEKLDYLAVTEGYEAFCRAFPQHQIGIVHGRMKPEVKEYEMQRFKKHETHIMVATTVIEVGVDVPNASVIVIENADKFGLSQLHQLRGRVGRGGHQSYCILMAGKKTSDDAKKRLRAMQDTHDGFKIAAIDMEIRGYGDFLGVRQSGHLPELRLANFIEDTTVFEEAREAAFMLIEHDPALEKPEHRILRAYFDGYMKKFGFLKDIA
ncbi:MAG: ATP-dependent DNA helicase RecG [Bacteroidota bacterium]